MNKNQKKHYIVKFLIFYFYKNYFFRIFNFFGNAYFINMFIFFRKKDFGKSILVEHYHFNNVKLNDLFFLHKLITNFLIYLIIFIIFATTILALVYKSYCKNTNYYYYCCKFSYFLVLLNFLIVFLWIFCIKNKWCEPYLYNGYIDYSGFIVIIVPNLHIVTFLWLSFYFDILTLMVGTLINVHFDFKMEDLKPYIYIYDYTRVVLSVFLTIYFSYIFLTTLTLYYTPTMYFI